MIKRTSKKTKIILSITALVEVLVLVAAVTFSWIEGGNKGYINGSEVVISSGSSLTMMQDGKITSSITIPACTLEETSSLDGRNFFFPMADNTSSNTNSMTFREGTPADRNTKYISLDFELLAADSATDVYLGAGTIIECNNKNVLNALRMSFTTNDGSDPIVFKPNQLPGITQAVTFEPIASISGNGVPTLGSQDTLAYGDFYYKGVTASTPIFELAKGETKNITLSIWLEGTEITSDDVANNNLKIYVDFTTSVDNLKLYNFVDNTHGYEGCEPEYWVDDKDKYNEQEYDTLMYIYDKKAQRYYAMFKSPNYDTDRKRLTYVPDTITSFCFRRYCVDIDKWWNEWVPVMDIPTDPNGEYTYVAICGQRDGSEGIERTPCGGYWKNSTGTYRVYFENSANWQNLRVYAWNSGGAVTGAYPGTTMTYSHNSDSNNGVFYIELNETDNVTGVSFNNNNTTQKYEITDKKYLFNGCVTWYDGSNSGKYLYTGGNSTNFN